MGYSHSKPTALRILQGNPGKRPLNKSEPQPLKGLPAIPDWLTIYPRAVENWQREGEILTRIGVMTEADQGVFAMRCYHFDQFLTMAEQIRREGRTIEVVTVVNKAPVIKVVTHPLIKQLEVTIVEYRRLGSLLGLDPATRSRIRVGNKGEQKDKLAEFLSNG